MATAVRARAGAALVVLALAGCSAGGSSTAGGAPSEAPGEAKQRMIAALTASDERPQRTLRAVSRATFPDGVEELSGCGVTNLDSARELEETTIFGPTERGDFSDCPPEWRQSRIISVGTTVFLTETYQDGSDVRPRPSRGWRECTMTGELKARQQLGGSESGPDPLAQFAAALDTAPSVKRSREGDGERLTAVLGLPGAPPGGEPGERLTLDVVLDGAGDLAEFSVADERDGQTSITTLRVVPTQEIRPPSPDQIEERVDVATRQELDRCRDPSAPAGGS